MSALPGLRDRALAELREAERPCSRSSRTNRAPRKTTPLRMSDMPLRTSDGPSSCSENKLQVDYAWRSTTCGATRSQSDLWHRSGTAIRGGRSFQDLKAYR